jgi:hypothetical protein
MLTNESLDMLISECIGHGFLLIRPIKDWPYDPCLYQKMSWVSNDKDHAKIISLPIDIVNGYIERNKSHLHNLAMDIVGTKSGRKQLDSRLPTMEQADCYCFIQ